MNNKNIALTIPVSGSLLKVILEAQEILMKQFKISYQYEMQAKPHINLFSGKVNNILILKQFLSKSSYKNNFEIESNGIGIFVFNHPVIYVRYKLSEAMVNIRNSLFFSNKIWETIDNSVSKDLWIPKTSIALNDTKLENLSQVLQSISNLNFNHKFNFKNFSFIKYQTGKKEKICKI